MYPSEEWISGKFKNKQKKWSDPRQVRDFLEALKPVLYIQVSISHIDLILQEPASWYRISQAQVQYIKIRINMQMEEVGAGGLLASFSGRLYNVLKYAYPDGTWDSERFLLRGKKSVQR